MKNLGIFLATIFVLASFSLSAGDNDPRSKKTSEPFGWGFYCMCAGEWLDVEGEMITMEKKHGMQFIFKGTAVGGTTGWIYDVKSVENLNELFNKGYSGTYTWTMTISLDDEFVAEITQKQHITVNANGELVVYRVPGPAPTCAD
jgi:hypothetical protein